MPQPEQTQGQEREKPQENLHLSCPNCDGPMSDRGCKLMCPRCGYFMGCSDFV